MRGMNQKRKRLGLWILFLAALLLTQFTVPVKASEPQIQDVNIQMVGGQIRTIDPMGLRMVACIKKSYIQELEKSGATVSYGIVLLPKKYLTEGQALTLDGKYLYNGSVYKPAKVPAVKKFSEDNDRIYFTAVLANLPKERYKNDYAARAYAEITRTVTEDDGKKKTTTEVVYSESEIDRQVYRIAEEAVNGTTETEETKQWLQDNILAPVDKPEELPEEEKKISFRLGKVSGVTLYHKTTSEAVKKEDYLVKVEMEDQPEIFAVITEVIAPQTETGKVSFKLDRKDYTTSQAGQTIEGAVVEFGTKSNDKVSTKYITMQSLIDQMKANPGGTYTLEHDIDASMVQGDDYLVPTFSGTFNGNGYKIKGLTTTLFGTVSGGKVQNVKLENVSITKVNSYKDAGGGTIANKAQKDAVIENVHVSGSLKSTNSRELLGGLVGRMDYAKVINLDKESEPDIYNAIKRNALLENVTLDENGKIDFDDKSVTENTRVSYPIDHIEKIVRPISAAPAAKNVIFLSADAFGVLPPVSILTPEQTEYYFLSGFTAKLAGTERGITEPTPTFSACFGQAFLELHPTKYAEELVKKMKANNAKAYLVNTGWNGTGKRISIKDTRGIIDAILNGDIANAPTKTIPYFNIEVPTELPGVDTNILDPRDTYADASEWDEKAKDLAGRFIKNFAKYESNEAGKALVSAGPQL